jgi:hypothetical protein
MESYSPVLIVSLAAMFFSAMGLVVRYAYKSKCTKVKLCCFSYERNIAEEVREDMRAMDRGHAVAPSGDMMNRQSMDMERR